MKRVLSIMLAGLFGIALSVGSVNAASSDCLNVKFDNGDSVCLGITKSGTRNFKISIDKSSISKTPTLMCYLTILDSKEQGRMYPLSRCQGSFTYTSSATQTVWLSVTYVDNKSDIYYNWLSTSINFKNGEWGSTSRTINSGEGTNNGKSSSKTTSDIELSTNRKSPSTSQYVNLTVSTDKKYTGKLTLSAKYRSSTSSSWTSISNTSSTYFSSYSDEWDDGYYRMTSSDKGNVTLSNLVKFRKNGYYRIYVKDTDGNESYVQFNVGESSSYNDDLKVSVSPSSPDTYEWVKLTIQTDDDYTGRINFSKFQYRSSSSSSWSDVSRTSSTYISDYSTAWSNGYYKMTSSDDGEAILKNLIKFKKSGYYRIYVEDTDGNESYIQFNVGDVDDDDDDSSSSKVSGFSSSELSKIKTVYKNWNSMIAEMQRKYPSLKKDTYWVRISNNLYDDLKDVVDNKKVRDFENYDDFQDAFDDWYNYTMRNI